MILKTQWNTGASYTTEGQVIGVVADTDTGEVKFTDFSRGITGTMRMPQVITLREFIISTDQRLQKWVHDKYLVNEYQPTCEWLKRI